MTTFEIYRQSQKSGNPTRGEWRWRASSKGRIKADGGESYKRRASCVAAIRQFVFDCLKGAVKVTQGGRELDMTKRTAP